MEYWDELDEHGNPTGRLLVRGEAMKAGSYHQVVHVWITNGDGEFLISKRAPNKTFPCMWETVGGSVLSGESSVEGALRGAAEEVGVVLVPDDGRLFKRMLRRGYNDHVDVWLYTKNVAADTLALQADEVSDARWATIDEIRRMMDAGEFIGKCIFDYVEELFEAVSKMA